MNSVSKIVRETSTAKTSLLWELLLISVLSMSLAFISGYRLLGYGFDYWDYVAFYDQMDNSINWNYVRFEPAYVYTVWFAKWVLRFPYELFSTIVITASLSIKFFIFRYYLKYWPLAIFSYILIIYPIHEYTQIRISLSLSFCLLALHLSFQKKLIAPIILTYIAFNFHYTSIVMIPFVMAAYFHDKSTIRKFVAFALPAISVVIYLFSFFLIDLASQFSVAADAYMRSTTYAMNNDTVNIYSVAIILPFIVLISSFILGFHKNNYKIIYIYMTATSLCVAFSFLQFPVFSHRLREIFTVGLLFIAFDRNRTPQDWIPAFFVAAYGVASIYLGIRDKLIFEY
ncbi:MAG: hypothetical protein CFE36_09790 [Sphingomonadaceae bacterium PASS1]|nr:MAG: hypothetical protein CFE36_09790 [Sphingomonadaceae bacterium PASS1]